MLGAAVERTPKIEQVNLNGGRLIREAKVRSEALKRFNRQKLLAIVALEFSIKFNLLFIPNLNSL